MMNYGCAAGTQAGSIAVVSVSCIYLGLDEKLKHRDRSWRRSANIISCRLPSIGARTRLLLVPEVLHRIHMYICIPRNYMYVCTLRVDTEESGHNLGWVTNTHARAHLLKFSD